MGPFLTDPKIRPVILIESQDLSTVVARILQRPTNNLAHLEFLIWVVLVDAFRRFIQIRRETVRSGHAGWPTGTHQG